jgi:hypothetical protein
MLLWLLAPLPAGADTLDVYALLTGKAVLMPTAVPRPPDSIIADVAADKTNDIPKIEKALAEQGLEVVQDGPHFVRVFPKGARDSLTNAPLRGAELAPSPGQGMGVGGMIDFINADVNQVVDIYAAIRQRTVLRPLFFPAPTITLRAAGTLSQEEVAYALGTVLALNGIRVVDDGAKFVQVVPMRSQVTAAAPKAEPGAKLFDPKRLPTMGVPQFPGPPIKTDRMEQEWQRLRKAFYDFMHLQDPRKRSTQRLFMLYADLAGKSAVPSQDLGGSPIWFHVETPLTKSELLYAIETTFTLHGLAIIPVDDHKIRLGRISEVMRNVGGRLERVPPKPHGAN